MKTLKITTKRVRFDSDVKWPDLFVERGSRFTRRRCPKCKSFYPLQVCLSAVVYFDSCRKPGDAVVARVRIMDNDLESALQFCSDPECDWSEDIYIECKPKRRKKKG